MLQHPFCQWSFAHTSSIKTNGVLLLRLKPCFNGVHFAHERTSDCTGTFRNYATGVSDGRIGCALTLMMVVERIESLLKFQDMY